MKNAFYCPLNAESLLWLFANFLYLPWNIKLSAFDKNDHYFSVSPSCHEIDDALKFPGSLFTPVAPRRRLGADVYASGGAEKTIASAAAASSCKAGEAAHRKRKRPLSPAP